MTGDKTYIDCMYHGQAACRIAGDAVHAGKHTYEFMPYRSQALFVLVNSFRSGDPPVVTLNHDGVLHEMRVIDITKRSITLEPA